MDQSGRGPGDPMPQERMPDTKPWTLSLRTPGPWLLKMRSRGRQLWLVLTVTALMMCVMIYSNSVVWKTIQANAVAEENSLGVGIRKLLEEEDQATEKFHANGMTRKLPQCIIVGVRKCGTRALLEFLNLHPLIQPADHEIHFFDEESKYSLGLEWYRKHMPYSFPEQITIEKSPRYFITEKVPERIHKMNSTIKLVVLLRNPVTRVISDYTQVYYNKLAKGKMHDRFEDLVIDESGEVNTGYKAVRISIYHHHFRRWLRVFHRHQIHVVDGDNLIVKPIEEIRKVEQFLGLQNRVTENNLYFNETRGFYCMKNGTNEKCLGLTKGRKHPDIDQQIIEKLQDFFRPHNKRLFNMMDVKFNWD